MFPPLFSTWRDLILITKPLPAYTLLILIFSLPLLGDEPAKTERELIGEVLGKPVYRDEIRKNERRSNNGDATQYEFPTGNRYKLKTEVCRLFLSPILNKYKEKHKKDIEPTAEELKLVAEHLKKTILTEEDIKELDTDPLPDKEEYLAEIEKVLADPDVPEEEKKQAREAKTNIDKIIFEPFDQQMARVFYGTWKFQKHLYDQYGGGRILFQQFGLEAYDAMHRFIKEQEKQGHFKINDPELRKALYAYWTEQEGSYALIEDPASIQEEFLTPFFLPKELWPELPPVKAPKPE